MGKQASSRFFLFLFALSFAALLGLSGSNGYRILAAKAKDQRVITDSILRWKASFMALSGTQERWVKTFIAGSGIQDLRTLRSLLNLEAYGLRTDSESLELKTSTEVTNNGIALKLTKLCLSTANGNFVVRANSYEQLLKGVDQLAHRPDIYIDNISVIGDKPVPEAVISDLCIYLRN